MKIIVLGGGPSGLYFALLAKKKFAADVTVYEQNPKDATFGFGIVLADRGLDRLKKADEESYDMIVKASFQSRNRVFSHQGESVFIDGGGYGGAISRLKLLQILQTCCDRAGIPVHYESRIEIGEVPEADLVVGADGANSVLRQSYADEFGVSSYSLNNKLAWYGTKAYFPYPLLSFKKTDKGQFWAVGYAYTENMGTFVAECDAQTWLSSGLSEMNEMEAKVFTEEIFADELDGNEVICNRSLWNSLSVTRVKNWHIDGNKVLIGDALLGAHPSIGSGTRIAMEDTIALVDALEATDEVAEGLILFEKKRSASKQKLVEAMEKSVDWYEKIPSRLDNMSTIELVFDYMMRTGRISEERLIQEYPYFMAKYQTQWKAFNSQSR